MKGVADHIFSVFDQREEIAGITTEYIFTVDVTEGLVAVDQVIQLQAVFLCRFLRIGNHVLKGGGRSYDVQEGELFPFISG